MRTMKGRPEPGVIGQDLLTQNPRGDGGPRHEKGWERRARERQSQAVAVVGLLEQVAVSNGGILSALKAPPMNDVMFSGTVPIMANGWAGRHFPQGFSAMTVSNPTSQTLTVHASNAAGQAPTVGGGVHLVPPGTERTFNVRGGNTHLTVYGTNGTTFGLVVYARPRDPSSGTIGSTVVNPTVINVPSPAVGADWSYTLPTTARAKIDGLAAAAQASAVVATRVSTLKVAAPGVANPIYWQSAAAGFAASQNQILNGVAAGAIGSNAGNQYNGVILPGFWLPPGCTISVFTFHLDVGDQWSNIELTVEYG